MALPVDESRTTGSTHTWRCLIRALPEKSRAKLVKVATMIATKLGQDNGLIRRRVIHSFKVALALVLSSALHNFGPSFYGFRANTIWAVVTVILVLEFSVGATLGKGLNRMLATCLGGALGVGTHIVSTLTGEKGQSVLTFLSVFVIGGTVTFLRFFPRLKARYDYGLMIFLLTFCLVSLSDYGDGELLEMAQERLLTIIIGSLIAFTVGICICPVWIGGDLQILVAGNIEKLANYFEGFGDGYFNNSDSTEAVDDRPFLQGHKSVLSSKSQEETMANLARWEPCHGRFRFRHPWKQYLKVGNLTRLCAYKIEALNVYLLRPEQAPHELRSVIQDSCTNISSECGKALKESSLIVRKMTKSSTPNPHVENAKNAAESLKSVLRTNPWEGADPLQVIPAAAVASLLIDVVICVEEICQAVDELASLANFVPSELIHRGTVQPVSDRDGSEHVVTVNE